LHVNIPERLGRLILPLASITSLAVLSGCGGYQSDYVPLEDGRARAVWRDDRLALEIGGSISPECAAAIGDPSGSTRYVRSGPSGNVWVPVYFGPRIVVVRSGFAPAPRRSAYVGSHPTIPDLKSGGVGSPSISGGGSGGGGSSGGGGGGGDLGKAVVVLAVVALVVLPAVALGLALGRPEPEREVATVIDRTNLYNDLSRTPGSPCSLYPATAQEGLPQ
jgi:hypothetical protein